MNEKLKYHGLALLVMFIWGLSYLSIKVIVNVMNPLTSAFYRFLLASIILYIVVKIKYPKEIILKEDKLKIALGGFFGVALYFFFENYSVLFTSASNVAILMSTIPVFTLLAERLFYKERLTFNKILGAVFSVIGIIIIVASKDRVTLFSTGTVGDLMGLGAALCWVLYNLVTRDFNGNYNSITVTTYQSIWGCLFLSPSLFLEGFKSPSPTIVINILFLAVFCSCAGFALYIYCLEQLGATVVTTYINLQPIITLVSAVIILKESISMPQILGSVIIIIGVTLVSLGDKYIIKKFREIEN